jgi:hypothetical protein
MRRVQGDAIDVAAVEAWVRTLGLEAAWAAALASA